MSKIPKRLRKKVRELHNFTCEMCGATEDDGYSLEIHHITPLSQGGNNDIDNLMLLCTACHKAAHGWVTRK